jgi:lysophospholipase L1-like esterase
MPLMHGVRATTYPEVILQGMMDARFGAGAVVVSTRAVGGTSSAQLLAGTDGLNRPWPQSVDADIVLLNHGINDSFLGVSEETYKADLLALMQAPGKVVFETPLPVSWAGYKDYAQIMRDTAAAEGVSVIDTAAFAATTSNWYGRYAQDGIHPNDAGYQLLVSGAVYPALEPMVAKLRCQ